MLIVDDYEANISALRQLLEAQGYEVLTATNGRDALDLVHRDHPDLVLLDVVMPGLSGLDVCASLKSVAETCLTPIVLVSALQERATRLEGLEAGADDFLSKPVDPQELYARVRTLIRLKRLTDDLESAESLFLTLGRFIEARDPYTVNHCDRLAQYATALGSALNLDPDDLDALYRGAFIHDIGKIAIPDRILLKKGKLTHAEYELMKQHPIIGDDLCRTVRLLEAVRPIVRHHHERLDGRGYPDGLAGDADPAPRAHRRRRRRVRRADQRPAVPQGAGRECRPPDHARRRERGMVRAGAARGVHRRVAGGDAEICGVIPDTRVRSASDAERQARRGE